MRFITEINLKYAKIIFKLFPTKLQDKHSLKSYYLDHFKQFKRFIAQFIEFLLYRSINKL